MFIWIKYRSFNVGADIVMCFNQPPSKAGLLREHRGVEVPAACIRKLYPYTKWSPYVWMFWHDRKRP